jgi:hypothetical protein
LTSTDLAGARGEGDGLGILRMRRAAPGRGVARPPAGPRSPAEESLSGMQGLARGVQGGAQQDQVLYQEAAGRVLGIEDALDRCPP